MPYIPVLYKSPIFILVMAFIKLKTLIIESSAEQELQALPKGTIFNDAKSIKDTFETSPYTWSETIEAYEKNKSKAKTVSVPLNSIKITQPNIQLHKVLNMLANLDKTPIIGAVKFDNNTISIFDGHHRLMANWALNNSSIQVNLVDLTKQ